MDDTRAVLNKTIIHVHQSLGDGELRGMERLEEAVKAGKTGFWWIAEGWFEQATHVCIWSEPSANSFQKLVVYKAPITGYTTVVWSGKKYRIIEFDAENAEWLDKPQDTRRAWRFDPSGVYRETFQA